MPILHIKTFLTMGHLIGLTLGLGGATILDIILLRLGIQGKAIQQSDANIVALVSKLVTWALVALWVSGIGFEIQYWYVSPEIMANPKVYAKLAIVVILTINGMMLHSRVLPIVYQRVGQPLFDGLPRRALNTMLVCGTISMFSWYIPFFLGIFRELNFVVPASYILAAYAAMVLVSIAAATSLAPLALRLVAKRSAPAATSAGSGAAAPVPLHVHAGVLHHHVMARQDNVALQTAWQAWQRILEVAPDMLGSAGPMPPQMALAQDGGWRCSPSAAGPRVSAPTPARHSLVSAD